MTRALFIIAAAFAAVCAPAHGQSACRALDADLQRGYEGACADGLANGYGEAHGAADYRGEFRAGRPHGKGVKTWRNGDRYEGDFVEGRKEGTGMYSWGFFSSAPGERYTGGFLKDRRHGYGVYEWPNGDRYAGPWENDRMTGPLPRRLAARLRLEAEHAVAVGRLGVRVCREIAFGVGVRDLVRGTVVAVNGERIDVRIDDPGRVDHMIGDRAVTRGAIVSESLKLWVPCT